VHVFNSLLAAKRALYQMQNKNVGHSLLKQYAEKGKTMYGFVWELVGERSDDAEHGADGPEQADAAVYTFRDCVESIFNGGKVRVTDETPRRVSVFDLIVVVTNSKNPHTVYQRMCSDHADVLTFCDNFTFSGQGQRSTPVTTAQGCMRIVALLPGKRAQQFRAAAMDTLVRFLAGDPSLHDEIDQNAARQADLPAEHPMQAFTDEVYANPKSSMYVLKSPNMKGKYIGQFYNKAVVYLLEWRHDGRDYVKVGWSDDFKTRMKDHFAELPGCNIYSVVAAPYAYRIEKAWKNDLGMHNKPIEVNKKMKIEIFTVSPAEAEQHLFELCEEQLGHDARQHEEHAMRMQMENDHAQREHERTRMEQERLMAQERMAHELEMKKLELQIMLLQHAKDTRRYPTENETCLR